MRSIVNVICLVVFVAALTACGGGGGGDTGGVVTLDFSTQMLDSMSQVYIQSPTEAGQLGHPGSVRQEITISSSGGTYQARVVESYFDGNDIFKGSEPVGFYPLVVNPDGTLSAAGAVTLNLVSDQSSYLVVKIDDGIDPPWTEDWYLDTPPAGWVSPTYEVPYQMLSHNVFESGGLPQYRLFVELTNNDLPISFVQYSSLTVTDDLGNNVVPSGGPLFWSGSSVSVDCQTGSCSWSNYVETAVYANFTSMPLDNYTATVDMNGGSSVGAYITYDEDIELPVVTSGTMLSAWSGSDIELSWTNPTGEANWNRVTELRLYIRDGSGTVGTVKLNPTDSTMTLTNAMLQDMYAIGDGTVALWRVQARTAVPGVTTNPQIARSHSNWVNLP